MFKMRPIADKKFEKCDLKIDGFKKCSLKESETCFT